MAAPAPGRGRADPAADHDLARPGGLVQRRSPRIPGAERDRARTDQSFCVPKAEIAANGYDLSINRYQELVHEEVEHRDPREILADLRALEDEIRAGLDELESML